MSMFPLLNVIFAPLSAFQTVAVSFQLPILMDPILSKPLREKKVHVKLL